MKTKLSFLFVAFFSLQIWAQSYTKSVISSTQTNGAYGIVEFLIDADSYMDLITASKSSNTVAYHINNGDGTFTQHIIDSNLQNATYAFANDLDQDGDMDFVAVGDSELVWYENDGSSNFTKHSVANITGANFVIVYDIDSDGDGDIGVAISGENYVTAFLNDGAGNFARINAISVSNPKMFHGGDFNGNGDADILVPSFDDGSIAWYYFNGIFFTTGGTVTSSFDGVWWAEGSDVDGDGDWDVVAASYNLNKISWFENDGTGTNFTEHVIDANLNHAMYLRVADLNNDSYLDIAATGNGNGASGSEVAVYMNDGNQNFTKTMVDNTEQNPAYISVQDFNDDGTKDLAFAASGSNEFVLLASQVSGINTQDKLNFTVYPNPAYDFIRVSADKKIVKVNLYDLTGRLVLTSYERKIAVKHFKKGYYLLQVAFENGTVQTGKILLK